MPRPLPPGSGPAVRRRGDPPCGPVVHVGPCPAPLRVRPGSARARLSRARRSLPCASARPAPRRRAHVRLLRLPPRPAPRRLRPAPGSALPEPPEPRARASRPPPGTGAGSCPALPCRDRPCPSAGPVPAHASRRTAPGAAAHGPPSSAAPERSLPPVAQRPAGEDGRRREDQRLDRVRARQGRGGRCAGEPSGCCPRSRRRPGHPEDGKQPGRAAAQGRSGQEGERVQVLRAAPQPPVQAPPRTVPGPLRHHRHDLALADQGAGDDQRAHRLVGRAQRRVARIRQFDREDPAPGHRPGEGHPARRRRAHLGARGRGQIRPAVARAVRGGRWLPAPYHRRAGRAHGPDRRPCGERAHQDQQRRHQRRRHDSSSPIHDAEGPPATPSALIMVRICGRRARCGHRRHPAPRRSRTLLLAIRVTRVDFARPATTLFLGRWPRLSVPCGTARRGVRT